MTEGWVREPAVARTFYPHQPAALRREIERCLGERRGEEEARVIVAPHAGYMYSGAVAGAAYARVLIRPRVVVLAPNHTGHGERLSLWAHGTWRLPTGDVAVAEDLAERLRQAHPDLVADRRAHEQEHALEVQLPFLLHRRPDVAVVPITLGVLPLQRCEALGKAIARVVAEEAEPVQIVASTDMSHYIPAATAKTEDKKAIDRILAIDPPGLFETVEREDITMCGYIPTTVALFAARQLGCTHAELCRYGNSGDATEKYDSVVGYASLLIR
jgi:MEMO1 family protein